MCLLMNDRKHERSPLGQVAPKPKRCTVHEKKLELVCKTCDNKPICWMCTTHGEHKNHESLLLKQEMDNLKTELQKKLEDLNVLREALVKKEEELLRSSAEILSAKSNSHFVRLFADVCSHPIDCSTDSDGSCS